MDSGSQTTGVEPDNEDTREPLAAPFDQQTFEHIGLLFTFLIGVMAFFGIIANVFNIVMFYRQGIRSHSCNVSLSAMAVSDFFYCLFAMLVTVINFIDRTEFDNFTFIGYDFERFLGERPSKMFSDMTSCITCYVAIERCVCVVLPFKANVFTAKRSGIAILCVTLVLIMINIPYLTEYIPAWHESEDYFTKEKIMLIGYKENDSIFPPDWALLSSYIFRPLFRSTCFLIILVCNITITVKVTLSHKFRKSKGATNSSSSSSSVRKEQTKNVKEEKTSKETKLVKMILAVCIVFSLCNVGDFVNTVLFIFAVLEWGYDYHVYSQLVFEWFVLLSHSVNSAINIVVYYSVSTRFRQELRLCLRIKEE